MEDLVYKLKALGVTFLLPRGSVLTCAPERHPQPLVLSHGTEALESAP